MPVFSNKSKSILETCDHHLVILMNEVIKDIDITVLYGHRSPQMQFTLFQKGRKQIDGKWVITNKSEVVTNCDGYKKLSDHNYDLSKAVDVAPYIPGKGQVFEERQCYFMGGYIKCKIKDLNLHKKIGWGGDWDNDGDVNDQNLRDLLHFYLL